MTQTAPTHGATPRGQSTHLPPPLSGHAPAPSTDRLMPFVLTPVVDAASILVSASRAAQMIEQWLMEAWVDRTVNKLQARWEAEGRCREESGRLLDEWFAKDHSAEMARALPIALPIRACLVGMTIARLLGLEGTRREVHWIATQPLSAEERAEMGFATSTDPETDARLDHRRRNMSMSSVARTFARIFEALDDPRAVVEATTATTLSPIHGVASPVSDAWVDRFHRFQHEVLRASRWTANSCRQDRRNGDLTLVNATPRPRLATVPSRGKPRAAFTPTEVRLVIRTEGEPGSDSPALIQGVFWSGSGINLATALTRMAEATKRGDERWTNIAVPANDPLAHSLFTLAQRDKRLGIHFVAATLATRNASEGFLAALRINPTRYITRAGRSRGEAAVNLVLDTAVNNIEACRRGRMQLH